MSFEGQSVLLRTAMSDASGYGRDGIHLAKLLAEQGVDLHVEPTSVSVPLPPIVAALFTKRQPNHFDLVIEHADPAALWEPAALTNICDRAVAWTMWEFTGFGGEGFEPEIERKLAYFDDVIGYCSTSKQALDQYHPRVSILQGGYQSSDWLPKKDTGGLGALDASRDWDKTFRFAMVGQLHARKNPFSAIKAFNLLKERFGSQFDAELHLKTNIVGLHPAMQYSYPGVRIFHDVWSHSQMRLFYMNTHCLVAPSWGEGKNLPALEAQSMGVPVLVSKCGGHLQWGSSEWNYWIDGQMVERDSQRLPGQMHVEVDIESMADQMWHIYNNRTEAREKGLLAQRTIPAMCDWENVVQRLDYKLRDTRPMHMRPLIEAEPPHPIVTEEDACPECGELAYQTAVGVKCSVCDWEYLG